MQRDAFISYSHRRDVPLAEALEKGLQDILRTPWLRRSRVKVFRDTTSLSAGHDLDGSIKAALADCRYFIYLASPEAAKSRWVREEIKYWRQNHGMEQFLIALGEGSVVWDPAAGDFDWACTDALPPELRGAFAAEPLWVDLTRFRDSAERSMKPGSEFRDRVAGLAAPLHGMAKDALDSTDLHIQRKAVRILRLFVLGLLLLSLLAGGAGLFAWQQRGEALDRARTSASQALAARALDTASKDPRKAAQFALYAQAVKPTGESAQALAEAVAANGSVARHLLAGTEAVADFHGVGKVNAINVAISRDGSRLAYYSDFDPAGVHSRSQVIHLYDIAAGRELSRLDGAAWPLNGGGMEFSADGRTLAVEAPYNQIGLWDVARGKLIRTIIASDGEQLAEAVKGLQAFAFSGDGRRLAATFYSPGEPEPGFHVAVWDTGTGRLLTKETAVPGSLALGFDDANRLLALDRRAGRIRGLAEDSRSWSAWRTIPGFPRQEKPYATLSDDGTRAYVGGQVWDLAAGRRLARADGEGNGMVRMPDDADGAVYAAEDRSVAVYDSALGNRRVLGSFTWPVTSVAVSGDGRWVAAGSGDGAVSLLSTTSYQAGVPLPNKQHLKPADLASDNRTAFRADSSGTDIWAVTDQGVRKVGRIPSRVARLQSGVNNLVASTDGSRVVVAQRGVLSLWDPRSGSRVGRTRQDGFVPVAFLADGVHVVGVSANEVQVLDTRSWKVLRSLLVADDELPLTAVSVSADRTTAAVVNGDELRVWKWDRNKGVRQVREVPIVSAPTMLVEEVSVSADGERVGLFDGDRIVSVLDVSTGKFVRGTSAATFDTVPVFSGDNTLLVQAGTSGGEPTLQFWDAATTESRGAWTLPSGGTGQNATPARLLPGGDGSVVAFGADGGLVRQTVGVAEWRKALCALTPQELPQEEYDRYLGGLDVKAPCSR
ncbi:toll/interleukin-1 receptor domain-containing protein [Streptomyces sp. NPDC050548]|uniref:toll/interleukin-1 receptor domain-containing protein n=1 Tax=Streptomyces sp. NPDC050548 TaxID=3365629 RepID=UPI00379A7A1F